MKDRMMIKDQSSYCVRTGRHRCGVVVGMSGGLDSLVTAWTLREQGYRVVGVTFRFFCYSLSAMHTRACCSEASIGYAREFCGQLGIPHHVVDIGTQFRGTVVKNFIEEYRRGRTPNPCIVCNERIKFPALARIADWLGLERIATGHYARLIREPGRRIFLASAVDTRKDQSYFLYRVPVKLLQRSVFPVGAMRKEEVYSVSSRLGIRGVVEKESQDVCFLPGDGLHAFVSDHIRQRPGDVFDSQGRILGHHKGISFYTIGQRKGLGISAGVPLYIKRIDARGNRIMLAPGEELYSGVAVCRSFKLRSLSLAGPLKAKIRYRHPPAEVATIDRRDGSIEVRFRNLQRAVTPGQSLVLYRNGMVVGGGIIECAIEGVDK